jgi:hypothetical protein
MRLIRWDTNTRSQHPSMNLERFVDVLHLSSGEVSSGPSSWLNARAASSEMSLGSMRESCVWDVVMLPMRWQMRGGRPPARRKMRALWPAVWGSERPSLSALRQLKMVRGEVSRRRSFASFWKVASSLLALLGTLVPITEGCSLHFYGNLGCSKTPGCDPPRTLVN